MKVVRRVIPLSWKATKFFFHSRSKKIELAIDFYRRGRKGRADVNRGKLCLKGIFEHELFRSSGRGKVPLIRDKRFQPFQETSWDAALDKVSTTIKDIQ